MQVHSIIVRSCFAFALIFVSSVASAGLPGGFPRVQMPAVLGANAADSWFFTTYQSASTSISWVTCGYDTSSSGCYGSGTLGPFVRACAVAGSSDRVYVLDSGKSPGKAVLYVYKQDESSTPSATLLKRVKLPSMNGSATAHCSLAVLGAWVYAGHDESPSYARVHLTDYSVQSGSTCGDPTTAITASNEAVVVSMGNCFGLFDKQGNAFESGGQFSDTIVPGSNGHALP